jgi:tRNA threonylcarbamoyladenosine biosynthesis protein TsaE
VLSLNIISNSPIETEELGAELGTLLSAGTFVALNGALGGGKTCFTRGIVASVAPQSAHLVASPTFAIMNSYFGDTPVYHFDFYRLTGDNEIAELGFDDYFYDDGVCVIEWSERLCELLPDDYISAGFDYSGENQRIITLTARGVKSLGILQQLTDLSRFQCSPLQKNL